MSIKREIILWVHCGMVFPHKMSHEVKIVGSFRPQVLKEDACPLRLRGHLCVQESSIKGKEPEEKENPKTQNYLLRQIQSRKGNIWLARRRTVGGVGAVHGWSGGEQPALCLGTEWCTPWGHCRRPNITDTRTHTHTFSVFTHMHAHTHTCLPAHACTRTQKP